VLQEELVPGTDGEQDDGIAGSEAGDFLAVWLVRHIQPCFKQLVVGVLVNHDVLSNLFGMG
jgi:hypothetical protein